MSYSKQYDSGSKRVLNHDKDCLPRTAGLENFLPFTKVNFDPEELHGETLRGVPLEPTDLLLEPLRELSEEYPLHEFLGGV